MLPRDNNRRDIHNILAVIQASTARVVVVFSTEAYLLQLMDEVALQNVTGRQWIASESLGHLTSLFTLSVSCLSGGHTGHRYQAWRDPGTS